MLSPQLESVQNTGEVREIFAKIQLVDLPGNLLYNTFVSNDRVFDNPKAVLDYLDIEFRKFDGKLFQFNGIEHSFSLEIYTYLDRLRNTYVSSRRGIEDRGVVSQQGFIESTISAENPGQNIISPLAQLEQSSITRQATDPTN
jgi:hypothetical protein